MYDCLYESMCMHLHVLMCVLTVNVNMWSVTGMSCVFVC